MNSLSRFSPIIRNYSLNAARFQSTQSSELVLVEVNDKTGISTVSLNRPPVNSLNLELLSALSKSLDELKANKTRGVILTSTSSSAFSAGLDINELYKPDLKRAREFWINFQDCWLKLFGSSFPTAAAINAHAPAGGCLLALSCEYRVMLPNFTIGLNETRLGIVAPPFFQATMKNTISVRETEKALTLGTLFTTDEALKVGLIDEIAQDKTECLQKCEKFLLKFKNISPIAREYSKLALRQSAIKILESDREADIDFFISTISTEKVQTLIFEYMKSLKAKK